MAPRYGCQSGRAKDPTVDPGTGESVGGYTGRSAVDRRSVRRDIPALPFCQTSLKARKPLPIAYPKALKTLGDHLRKRRLDKKLLQKEVGHLLGVDKCTINNWETNRATPALFHIPRIIKFIGYIPWEIQEGDIKTRRQLWGISQESLAKQIGVDPGTVARWETGKRKPGKVFLKMLGEFFMVVF